MKRFIAIIIVTSMVACASKPSRLYRVRNVSYTRDPITSIERLDYGLKIGDTIQSSGYDCTIIIDTVK